MIQRLRLSLERLVAENRRQGIMQVNGFIEIGVCARVEAQAGSFPLVGADPAGTRGRSRSCRSSGNRWLEEQLRCF